MKFFRAKYPATLKFLYPGRISKLNTSKAIYLTFDDGPIPEITPWVLDQLKIFNAKATFFCIGDNVKKHPEVFQRILKEDHCIGNHTFNHLNGWKTPTCEYLENVQNTRDVFESGSIPENQLKLFRPPYGRIKNSQARALKKTGYEIVMWDVISGDYDADFSAETCYQNIIKNAKAGSTIVLHDSKKAYDNLKIILPRILEYYRNKGLEFRSLKDVL